MTQQVEWSPSQFGTDDFAMNPEPGCACILLLDTSGSMAGAPISELNGGIREFVQQTQADPLAAKRVEVAIMTFGPLKVHSDFQSVTSFQLPVLEASGDTPMGAAIVEVIDMVQRRKDVYKAHGVPYFRPWIFLITDGAPTDSWSEAARLVREGEEQRRFSFFAVGVESANIELLSKISVRPALKLRGLGFRELFLWLSSSMKKLAASNPQADSITLPPAGWAQT